MTITVLKNAFRIQHRVLGALIRREFIMLTSKRGSGFLMLMFEPMLFTLVVVLIFALRKAYWGRNIPILEFALSGFSIMWATRLQIIRSSVSVQIGAPLLYHRHVKAVDIILAKAIITSFTSILGLVIIYPMLIYLEIISTPEDLFLVVFSWILAQWYAFIFSLISGAIVVVYAIGNRVCMILNVGHAFVTGCFYMVYWFPDNIKRIALMLPMVNACEMMRDGMFGSLCKTYYNIPYIIICNIVLTYVGFAFCRKCENISSFDGIN